MLIYVFVSIKIEYNNLHYNNGYPFSVNAQTQDCSNSTTWTCGLSVKPEVQLSDGESQQVFEIPPNITGNGIYKHLDKDGRLLFGCGVFISRQSANQTMSQLIAAQTAVTVTLMSSNTSFYTKSCPSATTTRQKCFKIGGHVSNDVRWDHPQNLPVFVPSKGQGENFTMAQGSRNVTVICELTVSEGGETLEWKTKSHFEWWDLPNSISIQPKKISGESLQTNV